MKWSFSSSPSQNQKGGQVHTAIGTRASGTLNTFSPEFSLSSIISDLWTPIYSSSPPPSQAPPGSRHSLSPFSTVRISPLPINILYSPPIPYLEMELYKDTSVPDLSHIPSPRLFSSHLPYVAMPESVKESNCRTVYLCRNPKDTFVSLWHFMRDRMSKVGVPALFEEEFDRFCAGNSIFGPLWDHVLGYWEESLRHPEKVLFLHYEEMKRDPALCLKKMGEFLRCPISEEEEKEGMVEKILNICSFEHMKNLETNKGGKTKWGAENRLFFRSGKVGDWVNHLTPKMIQHLDDLTEKKLLGSGFKFMEA